MVQFFKGSVDPRAASYGALAESLGGGLGNAVNTHYATKALDSVFDDEKLKDAPQSKKMSALQRALQPYGQKGMEILQQRMQVNQLEQQEKQEKVNNIKGDVLRRRLEGESISEKEKGLFTPAEELAIQKHIQQGELGKLKANNKAPAGGLGGQPISPEIATAIEKVITENPDATPDQLGLKLTKAGVPPSNQTPYLENRRREIETNASLLEKGYKSQEAYLNGLTKSIAATEEMDMKLDRIAELKDVPTPLLSETMQALGIPIALFSAEGEELEKLSNDLTKNIQQFYGSRILQSEFQNFLKSIPTLKNSQEGRERIIANMKMFNNLKRLEYNTARAIELDYEAKNKPLPPSFQRIVYDEMKPKAEKFANEWKNAQNAKLSQKKQAKTPEGKVRVQFTDAQGKKQTGTMSSEKFEEAKKAGEKYELIK